MIRRHVAIAAACGLFLAPALALQAQGPGLQALVVVPKGAEEVWKLEGQRRAALIAGDLKTLGALCADDMVYTHSNGKVDTKKSLFEALQSGATKYEAVDFLDVSIARYDSAVVIVGVAQIAVKTPSGPVRFRARFSDLWAKQQKRWRFVAWQTTRLPE